MHTAEDSTRFDASVATRVTASWTVFEDDLQVQVTAKINFVLRINKKNRRRLQAVTPAQYQHSRASRLSVSKDELHSD